MLSNTLTCSPVELNRRVIQDPVGSEDMTIPIKQQPLIF